MELQVVKNTRVEELRTILKDKKFLNLFLFTLQYNIQLVRVFESEMLEVSIEDSSLILLHHVKQHSGLCFTTMYVYLRITMNENI